MSDFKNSWLYVLGFVSIGMIIGIVLTTGLNIDSKGIAGKSNPETIYTEASDADQDQNSLNLQNLNPGTVFVDVVKKVRPSIVTIYTTKNVKVPANPWHNFFRDFGFDENQNERGLEMKQRGLGSGIIISKDGYILSNHHVIKDVDELRVLLVDDREYEAKVIGTDPTTEIALIKIDADDLPVAKLGDSEKLEIGEWVLAIGSPLELNFTVTAGIVSALSRDINIIRGRNSSYSIEDFIQTDAAINPGNSGGALVNSKGEVIGVNTAIATPTGNYVGYGFAVPINIAKNVMDDFLKYGEVRRGYLGVYIEEMTPLKAKAVGLDKPQGVFISSVIENNAADKAGIKAGDVILEVENVPVNKPNQLQAKVGSFDPSNEISLLVWRDGKKRIFKVKLEGRENELVSATSPGKTVEKKVNKLGFKIQELSSSDLSRLNLESGVQIQAIENDSPAANAGLIPNDVIYELDGKKIKTVSDFKDHIDSRNEGEIIKLQIRRKDNEGNNFDRLVFMEIPKG